MIERFADASSRVTTAVVSMSIAIALPASALAEQPGVDAAGNCTKAFIDSYIKTSNEIGTVLAYSKSNERPPNLFEALAACDRMDRDFPGTACRVPSAGATASTTDFAEGCKVVRDWIAYSGDDKTKPIPPEKVTEESPLSRLEPARIRFTVKDSSELQKALEKPGITFVIDGKVYGLKESLPVKTDVRCAFNLPMNVMPTLANGASFEAWVVEEAYQAGYRHLRMELRDSDFGIDCVSKAATGLTLGQFRTAFGNLAEITYAK